MMTVENLLKSMFQKSSFDIKEVFENKLTECGISKTMALKLLNIDKDVFDEIINGTAKQPNLINIIKISEFLDIELNEVIEVVLKNQNVENIKSIEDAKKASFIMKNFDVKSLTRMGFFEKKSSIDQLIDKILSYFGFESIADYMEKISEPLYSKVNKNHSDKMKDFWITSAYQTFNIIDNPNIYNRDELIDLIVKIRPYSQDLENGLLTVCKALYNKGITVIFQNYLTTTQVRGATFVINNKPCIVITDFNKNYPTLWFTLIHELYHVLYDFEKIKTNAYHLSDNEDLFLTEEKANNFARDFFLTVEQFNYIKTFIKNPYIVEKFATKLEVHVSLIYSFYTWYQNRLYGKNYHAAFKSFYPDFSRTIKKLNPIQWDEDNLLVSSEKIKQILELT